MSSQSESGPSPPFLSIVIPAFDEERRILNTLEQVADFLAARPYSWEVVVADDGSRDSTNTIASDFSRLCQTDGGSIRVLTLPHRGKGWAVRRGMLAARGQFRFICDADLSMPIEQVERFLPPELDDVDLVVGSREAPGSRRFGEPSGRQVLGRVYNRLVKTLAVPGLNDTQCGFKCFRGEVVPQLFQRQTIDGFAFDVELLYLAARDGLRVREVGIDWHYREHSKVRPLRDSLAMAWDLLKIRWRHRRSRPGSN